MLPLTRGPGCSKRASEAAATVELAASTTQLVPAPPHGPAHTLRAPKSVGVPLPYVRHTDLFTRLCNNLLTQQSGNIFRVGIFLDFVRRATRTPHGAYVR